MNDNSNSETVWFSKQRAHLRRQLENRGISDSRVLDAIERVPRERFVSDDLRDRAYADNALPIASDQTISQPYIVALMTEALSLTGTETVLEIGTGSGYQTAILALLCQHVVTVERIAALSHGAQTVLDELGFRNIDFQISDGSVGCPARALYEGIIVTAAAPHVPEPLCDQLKTGGRLVVPVGDALLQTLTLIEKRPDRRVSRKLCACRFVKLIGAAAWPETLR